MVFRAVGNICPGDKVTLGLRVCSATRRRGSFPCAWLPADRGGQCGAIVRAQVGRGEQSEL